MSAFQPLCLVTPTRHAPQHRQLSLRGKPRGAKLVEVAMLVPSQCSVVRVRVPRRMSAKHHAVKLTFYQHASLPFPAFPVLWFH